MIGVESLNGAAGDQTVTLTNSRNGLTVDLGAGSNDQLTLALGSNTLSVTGVEQIGSSDFSGSSNDILTLLDNVSGVGVNLGGGTNALESG